MATFIKRGGKYQVMVRRKGFAPACRTFHLKADAEEWARFMETKADRGDLPTPVKVLDSYKVRDILVRYRDEITVKKRSADTETYILDAFLRQPIANLTLAQITPAHFSTYREKRLREVKPGTVNRELSTIKHAFEIAEREWDIPLRVNPLAKLKKLKASNARTRRLSPEEYEALQAAFSKCRNPHIMLLVRFAIATGMRRGEIIRLRWSEVDKTVKTLHIPITKNGHARTIPLSTDAIAILDEIQCRADDEREEGRGTEYVFPFSDNAAKLAWQRLVSRAGIEDLHFHDLRHEAI